MTRKWTVVFLLALIAVPASGWGLVGHGIVNEAATYGVPSEMPEFFHEAYPRLVWLGYEPDRWRGAGDSIDAFNAPNHFLDFEYVSDLELPSERYEYIRLLDVSGTLKRFGIDLDTPGFLPWRIAEVSEQLEREWRNWSREDLSRDERKAVEESIVFLSGVLGHYVADAANPHHATIHYNGWAIAPAPAGYATDCSTHSRFESYFVTKSVEAKDVFEEVAPPTTRPEYFATAVDLVKSSQARVDQLYRIDAQGGFDPSNGSEEAHRFVVSRLAVGASVLRDLWWTAYRKGVGE